MLINFVVISRPGYPLDRVEETISRNFAGYNYEPASETWRSGKNKGCFILKHMEPVPISSTQIRERIRTGKDISDLVPRSVEEYISTENLYKD
jgi:nicotinic acid mononucleotide adenylyltransferase